MVRLRKFRLLILLLVTLVATACGGNQVAPPPPTSTATDAAAFPVTITAANGDVLIGERPERIVSLSATSTEMLFAIGAGDQVVAADEYSNYPPEAPTTKLSGFEPNAEAIADLEPDLVVVSDDVGDIVKSMDALHIPVLVHPAAENLDASYSQLEQLGAATGNITNAAKVVESMQLQIEELTSQLPHFEQAPTYYHELDQTYFSVTSDVFIGQVYSLVGLENIADRAEGAGPYPQLSAEFIVDANPDLIFLADTKCCAVTAQAAADRPGWDQIAAVKTGSVIELDDDVASRWGPRIVDLLRIVIEAVSRLERAAN